MQAPAGGGRDHADREPLGGVQRACGCKRVAHVDLGHRVGAAVLVEEAQVRHEGACEGEQNAKVQGHRGVGKLRRCVGGDRRVPPAALLPAPKFGGSAVAEEYPSQPLWKLKTEIKKSRSSQAPIRTSLGPRRSGRSCSSTSMASSRCSVAGRCSVEPARSRPRQGALSIRSTASCNFFRPLRPITCSPWHSTASSYDPAV